MPDDIQIEDNTEQTEEAKEDLRRCHNCKWWLQALIPEDEQSAWGKKSFDFGECRFCPPTALPTNRQYESAGEVGKIRSKVTIKQARFPHTFGNDWCGCWHSKGSG